MNRVAASLLLGVLLAVLTSYAEAQTKCVQCEDCHSAKGKLPEPTVCQGATVEDMCETVIIHEHSTRDIIDRRCPSIPPGREKLYKRMKTKEGFLESVHYCFGAGCNDKDSSAPLVSRAVSPVLVALMSAVSASLIYFYK